MIVDWGTFIPALVGGSAKTFFGWLKNAKDSGSDMGEAISSFEIRKLIETMVSFVIGYAASMGVFGLWLNVEYAEAYSAIAAWGLSSIWDTLSRKLAARKAAKAGKLPKK